MHCFAALGKQFGVTEQFETCYLGQLFAAECTAPELIGTKNAANMKTRQKACNWTSQISSSVSTRRLEGLFDCCAFKNVGCCWQVVLQAFLEQLITVASNYWAAQDCSVPGMAKTSAGVPLMSRVSPELNFA